MNLNIVDIGVIGLYFAAMGAIVWWVARKNRSTDSYYLGNSTFPGWVIALTLLATIISSQTFIAGPADGFRTSLVRLLLNILMPVGAIIVAIYLVPFFRSGFESAYEYLAARFSRAVCTYTAGVFLLTMVINLSMVSYLISVLLGSITGLPLLPCLIIVAGSVGVYTSFGGFRGVVWTDVAQTFVLIFGGIATLVIIVYHIPGGFPEILREAWQANKLSFAWDLEPGEVELSPIAWAPMISEKSVVAMVFVSIFSYLLGA